MVLGGSWSFFGDIEVVLNGSQWLRLVLGDLWVVFGDSGLF